MSIIKPGGEVGKRGILDGMWELRLMGCTKGKDSACQCHGKDWEFEDSTSWEHCWEDQVSVSLCSEQPLPSIFLWRQCYWTSQGDFCVPTSVLTGLSDNPNISDKTIDGLFQFPRPRSQSTKTRQCLGTRKPFLEAKKGIAERRLHSDLKKGERLCLSGAQSFSWRTEQISLAVFWSWSEALHKHLLSD